ncbi:MAG: hypothetical protein KatS3mg038_0281 [Candidatus Kapaibacterium sp.]|nr:MAG: hypothetical protein KatS3mg038_0281 [Candidatus Kapabacteria bacterium]
MTIEKIRMLLPDYAAGMLSDDERLTVEDALRSSPELQAELEAIRALFDAFPPQSIQRELDWQTHMLSVRVVEQLRAARSRRRVRWHWLAVTVACVAAIVVAIVLPERNNREPEHPPVTQSVPRAPLVSAVEESSTERTVVPAPLQSAPTQLVRAASGIHQHSTIGTAPIDAIAIATFPYDAIDSEFVEQFAEVFSDETLE